MEAIILAGGFGTRLREIVDTVPKPMAPVDGKPFLYYIFRWLNRYQVSKVIISGGYKSESIIGYFGNSFMGIPVVYAIEEKPLGTGGAIMFSLMETTEANILIVNGDTYFPVDLNMFYNEHLSRGSKITIALSKMKDFSRYGTVECKQDYVTRFNEKKPCKEGLINGGIYLINRAYLESKQLSASFSFEKEILEKETVKLMVKCMAFNDPFIDIGIPEDYLRASSVMKSNETE